MSENFTESHIIQPEGSTYVFAVTVNYDTETGEIQNTDFSVVMNTEK